jgi:5-formyltetrahydrofolate cyclo-ligase
MHRWSSQSTMIKNSFHIPEPVNEARVAVSGIELLIIPLVAWDGNGGRLGMGAGFYDQLLAPLQASRKPRRLGLAYGMQEVAAVPVDEWDIPLHGVICERGWTMFSD